MPALTSSVLFIGAHRGVDSPDDPNLFSADEIAAYAVPSTSASAAVSIVTSQVASGGLGSIPISTADSKAVSSGLRASISDSKTISGSTNTSVADSKSISNSVNISVADSKATSVGAATFVPTVGAIPGFQQPFATAVIRTANSKMADALSVKDFGARGDGVTDDTAAIRLALAAGAANSFSGAKIWFPAGTYKITDTITITANRQHLYGDGKYATTILFVPSSAKACFVFTASGSEIVQCSLRDMAFSGSGTQQKIAVDIWDVSDFELTNVVTTSWTGNSGSSATPSIAFRTNGREMVSVSNVTFFADRPIHIRVNPDEALIALDHSTFHNCYLAPQVAAEDCILVDPACAIFNISFTGRQAWVLGRHGLNAQLAATTSYALSVSNVRREQTQTAPGYAVLVTGSLFTATFINCVSDSLANGFNVQVTESLFMSCRHNGGAGTVGLNISNSNDVHVVNSFFQAGCTVTATNMVEVLSLDPADTEALPISRNTHYTTSSATARSISIYGQKISTFTGSATTGTYTNLALPGSWVSAVAVVSFSDAAGTATKGGAGTFLLKGHVYSAATPPSTSCGVEAAGASVNCVASNSAVLDISAGQASMDWAGQNLFRFYNKTGVTVHYTITVFGA